MKKISATIIIILICGIGLWVLRQTSKSATKTSSTQTNSVNNVTSGELDPFTIESLRSRDYPGSMMKIEQTLADGSAYHRYIVSYLSDGLKIYGLLTVPLGEMPVTGWPTIIFNHGYIPPKEYKTDERYVAYVDGFARNGYIVFKPDFRGHGNSEGEAVGAYGSNAYTIDVLNALASVKKLKDPVSGAGSAVDSKRIGMWGHSLGGFLTLRAMVVAKDIKAGVIWSGVVGSYTQLLTNWHHHDIPPASLSPRQTSWRQKFVELYGPPSDTSPFWNSISATSFLGDISGPLQLHYSATDPEVPPEFSRSLVSRMRTAGKTVGDYEYPSDDHNLSQNFSVAMERSVAFFDKYLK